MIDVPVGTTHFYDFYGNVTFYRAVVVRHLNQVEEAWQTFKVWEYYNGSEFERVDNCFSDRTLKPIHEYF